MFDQDNYIVHLTKTALYIEQLAKDIAAIREQNENHSKSVESIRNTLGALEKEFAVYKVGTSTDISANKETIRNLEEKLRWLSRLVIGALISGVISGIVALIFKVVR